MVNDEAVKTLPEIRGKRERERKTEIEIDCSSPRAIRVEYDLPPVFNEADHYNVFFRSSSSMHTAISHAIFRSIVDDSSSKPYHRP